MLFSKVILSSLALVGSAFATDYETEENVLVLGDDTLAGAIEEFPFILVEFYAPWCGHCKQLAPEYAKAATTLSEKESEVKLAKVDATEHTKVASEFGVSGYPTLKFFKNGEASDYGGGRTASEIVSWLEKKTGPSVAVVEAVEDLDKLKEENPLVFVLYASDSSEENKALKHFTKVADSNDDVKFVQITSEEVAKSLELTEDNSAVLFKGYDEGRVNYEGKVVKSQLTTFLKGHLLPYVVEFSDDIVGRLFGGDLKEHMLYFRKEAQSDADVALLEEYRTVAKNHLGELIFVAVDMEKESNGRLAEFFGLTDDAYPAIRIININSNPIKYSPPEGFEFNEAGFELFASKYLAGELSATLNTEEVPDDWDSEELKVVVGKNFDEVVLDETKNVFLMAHAPWCGHCKSLMPIFEELAEHFEDDENVVIAKMDSTKNEVNTFSVEGFPTLKFFPSGSTDMLDYEGGRELQELIDYVDSHRGDGAKSEAADDTDDEDDDDDDEDEDHDEL